jgi:hypothetical protein
VPAPPTTGPIYTQQIGRNKDESLEDPEVIKRRHFVKKMMHSAWKG